MQEYTATFSFGAFLCAIALAVLPASSGGAALQIAHGSLGGAFEGGTTLFLGDVMLARGVEQLMRERGSEYPFAGIAHSIERADVAVGNFEGVVSRTHEQTQSGEMRFSIRAQYMEVLSERGIDVLGLANNHSGDFGSEAAAHTLRVCAAANIRCIGHHALVAPEVSTTVLRVGSTNIGLIAVHDTYNDLNRDALAATLLKLGATSDFKVAYVHWGEEYEPEHSAAQEELAHFLIEEGADAVVGHHPHVVQDVGMYRGKPIFYSLGNTVFDQYFSDEVQTGLLLQMHLAENSISYQLIPVSSINTPSQPHLMPIDEQRAFVDALITRSGAEVAEYWTGTSLTIPHTQ